jgi:hypothetical protein
MRVKNVAVFAIIIVVVYAARCASNTPPPISVSISPQSSFVGSGQVIQFSDTVTGDASGVNWSVNGITGGNSTVGIIDSLYTAPSLT